MSQLDDQQTAGINKGQSRVNLYGPLASIGSIMAVAMAGFGYLGYRLDLRYDLEPYGLIAGLFMGLFLGFYETWKWVRCLDPGPAVRRPPTPPPEERE